MDKINLESVSTSKLLKLSGPLLLSIIICLNLTEIHYWHSGYGYIDTIRQCKYFKNASDVYAGPQSWSHPSQDALETLILKRHGCPVEAADGVTHIFLLPVTSDCKRRQCWQHHATGMSNVQLIVNNKFNNQTTEVSYRYDAQLISIDGDSDKGPWTTQPVASITNKVLKAKREYNYFRYTYKRIFELASFRHDWYLLTLRLTVDDGVDIQNFDVDFSYQNDAYTKAWQSSKAIYLAIVLAALAWYGQRLCCLTRPLALLEKFLIILAIAATIRNVPLGFLQLATDFSSESLLEELQNDIFYFVLLCFWIVIASEKFILDTSANCTRLKLLWKPLTVTFVVWFLHVVFNVYAHSLLIRNPFTSFWDVDGGEAIILSHVVVTSIIFFLYVFYLGYLMFDAVMTHNTKRSAGNPTPFWKVFGRYKLLMIISLVCNAIFIMIVSNSLTFLYVVGGTMIFAYIAYIIYNKRFRTKSESTPIVNSPIDVPIRYMLLVIFTFLLSVLTMARYITGEAYIYDRYPWGSVYYDIIGFYIGVHSLWNIHIVSLLYLYAPSTERSTTEEESETIKIEAESAVEMTTVRSRV